MTTTHDYSLPRTGQALLTFTGYLLAEAGEGRLNGRDLTRWHTLALYQTAAGEYVAHISYTTRYQGEAGWDGARTFATATEVAAWLAQHDPTEYVRGFPDGDAYAKKQERLLREIRTQYQGAVSELLAQVPAASEPARVRERSTPERTERSSGPRTTTLSTKLSDHTLTQLSALEERWDCTRTTALETAIGMAHSPVHEPEVVRQLSLESHDHTRLQLHLTAWATALADAAEELGLSRAEWNYLADVLNGCWLLPPVSSPQTLLAAEVEDGHRLNGLGPKWFSAADADERVRHLVERIMAMSYTQAWAVLAAVTWFWDHSQEIDHQQAEWWRPSFQRTEPTQRRLIRERQESDARRGAQP